MSGPVIAGLVTAGIMAIVAAWSCLYLARADEASMHKHAARFARSAGVVVPAELVGWTGDRARRRHLAGLTVMVPLMMLVMFAIAYSGWQAFDSVGTSGHAHLMPMTFALAPLWMILLAAAAGEVSAHLWEHRRMRRAGVHLTAGDQVQSRRAFIPPALTWLVRGIVALCVLDAAMVVARDSTSPASWWALAGLAGGALAVLLSAETGQLRVIRADRLGSTPGELVLDDIILARTALAVGAVPAGLAFLGAAWLAWPLAEASRDPVALGCCLALFVVGLGSGGTLVLIWSQNLLRRYWVRAGVAPGPSW